MSSSHSGFQLEAIFTSGFVLKVKSYLRELFFQFLILPGCYFHQLDLFTKSYCICGSSFFFICYQGNPHYAWKTTALNILSFTRSNWYQVNIFPFQASPVLKNYLKICSPRFFSWRSGGGCHNHSRGTTFLLLKVTMLHMIHLMASWWCRQYLEQDNYSLARRSRGPNLQATKQNLKSITSQGCRNKE